MLSLRRGRVTAVVERHDELTRLAVDGIPCVAYPRLTGPVELEDDVIVNVQARELGLGSGGFDVLYANLTRGLGLPPEAGAHVMKLPYTPLQTATRHVEEEGPLPHSIGGMPVVCCTLHSQVAPVCAGIGAGVRVAYVQLPGGALPVPLSAALRALRARGLLEVSVAVGACLDGDRAAVSVASALAWAAGFGCNVAVCAIGPGIVGTGSLFGHGGVAAAEAANAANALRGRAILAARVSEADARERHRGASHHTRAALELSIGRVTVAWPAGRAAPDWLEPREEVDVDGWRAACEGLPLSHMGRGPEQESAFFGAAFAAGRLARSGLG
jgi:Protein of unknown function (DUF3866)